MEVPLDAAQAERLRLECFADDLAMPDDWQSYTEGELRAYFESGGQNAKKKWRVEYRNQCLEFRFAATANLGQLRRFLYEQTRVHPTRQKLIGFKQKQILEDDTLLDSLTLASKKLILMGLPFTQASEVDAELTSGRAAASGVKNDLKDHLKSHTPRRQWERRPTRQDGAPVLATRGGGVYLNP